MKPSPLALFTGQKDDWWDLPLEAGAEVAALRAKREQERGREVLSWQLVSVSPEMLAKLPLRRFGTHKWLLMQLADSRLGAGTRCGRSHSVEHRPREASRTP